MIDQFAIATTGKIYVLYRLAAFLKQPSSADRRNFKWLNASKPHHEREIICPTARRSERMQRARARRTGRLQPVALLGAAEVSDARAGEMPRLWALQNLAS